MHWFLVVIEKAPDTCSAYSPDLAGSVATGRTRKEAERRMREAIRLHLDGLLEDGLAVPEAHSSAEYMAV